MTRLFRAALAALSLALLAVFIGVAAAAAQERKPAAKDVSAIRACAEKYADNVDEGERRCLFRLVADPCLKRPDSVSTHGMAECYRVEQEIWDGLLNDNFKALRGDLDDDQQARLREMQRAWIAYRDSTCAFYQVKIQGTLAVPMGAACVARETARRALLLKIFSTL
jgi:uncharacterized protein YecT (DUF1311 family)